MYKIVFTAILLLCYCTKTYACLNGAKLLKTGSNISYVIESEVPRPYIFFPQKDLLHIIKLLEADYLQTKNPDYLSDKGIVLVALKKYKEAIDLYLKIEKMAPNRYATATNIGTAYELIGQNEKALQWLEKAVAIDPSSHRSSEWIHVNILKAKIKGEQLYTSDFLLNTNFGDGILPKSNMTKSKLKSFSDQLYYQLTERISFVKTKDKIVAQLLFDLGNASFLLGNYKGAIGNYDLAKTYGLTGGLVDDRIQEAKRLSNPPKPKVVPQSSNNNYTMYAILAVVLLGGIGLGIFIVKRKRIS